MHGLTNSEPVARTEHARTFREGSLVLMCVGGLITDEVSAAWQAELRREVQRAPTRFVALDTSEMEPANSMRARFRTAAFAKEMAAPLAYVAVLTGSKPGPLVVVRAVLRLAGVQNIELFADVDAFRAAVKDMAAGRTPSPGRGETLAGHSEGP